jgi:hypothetical protein
MRAVFKSALAAASLGAFLVLGCDDPASPGKSNPVAGRWDGIVAESTMTMVFTDDSAFSTVLPDSGGTYYLAGTYTFTNTSIALTYTSALQGTEGIPLPSFDPVIGTLSGTSMTLPVPYNWTGDSVTLSKLLMQ